MHKKTACLAMATKRKRVHLKRCDGRKNASTLVVKNSQNTSTNRTKGVKIYLRRGKIMF